MIKFQFTIDVLQFDEEAYIEKMRQNILQQFKIGVGKFYSAAVKRIPVRTGFVRGAFSVLRDIAGTGPRAPDLGADTTTSREKKSHKPSEKTAKILRTVGKLLERSDSSKFSKADSLSPNRRLKRKKQIINRKTGKKEIITIKIPNEYYYTPNKRKVLKTPSSGRQFATKREQVLKVKDNKFTFVFGVDISYFTAQDLRNIGRSPTAPWLAIQTGQQAFEKHLANKATLNKMFPEPLDFFQKTFVTVNERGIEKKKATRTIKSSF